MAVAKKQSLYIASTICGDYSPPSVTALNDHEFALDKDLQISWIENGDTHRLTARAGMTFDGSSVPRWLWSLTGILPTGVSMGAAGFHDPLYQVRGLLKLSPFLVYERLISGVWVREYPEWNREQCDDIFRMVMRFAHETAWKEYAMWKAVRIFGGIAWNQ